jgi:hypothetical protein
MLLYHEKLFMKTLAKQWLDYAQADLLACEKLLDDDFLTNIVAFHSFSRSLMGLLF